MNCNRHNHVLHVVTGQEVPKTKSKDHHTLAITNNKTTIIMMDPYFSHIETNTSTTPEQSTYPIVTAYPNRDECCSTLDGSTSVLDEERGVITNDQAITDSNVHGIDNESGHHPPTVPVGSFASLSRRIIHSPPLKKCIFFSCVFLVLSSVGLATVGLGLSFGRESESRGGDDNYDVRSSFHHGGGEIVSGVEKELMTEDDLQVNVTSKVAESKQSQANTTNLLSATVPNIESTEVWGTEPTTTSTNVAAIESTTASEIDPPKQDTHNEWNPGMTVPANLIDVEFSMSMIVFDDEFSMPDFPQDVVEEDFQQFNAEVSLSMSMSLPEFSKEKEKEFQQFEDEIDISVSMSLPDFTKEEGFQQFDNEIDVSVSMSLPDFTKEEDFQQFDNEIDVSVSMSLPDFSQEEEDFQQLAPEFDSSMSMDMNAELPDFTNEEEDFQELAAESDSSMSMDMNGDLTDFLQEEEVFQESSSMSMDMNTDFPDFSQEEEGFQQLTAEWDSSMSMDMTAETIIPLVSTDSTELAVATKPFPNRDCVETMCAIELSPELLMEYQLEMPTDMAIDESGCQGCAVTIHLTYDGIAWIGFGFSTNGAMVGSEAVIGLPVLDSKQVPQKYILGGMSVDNIQPMSEEHQTLQNASIKIGKVNNDVKTVMKFTKILQEQDEIEIFMGDNTFIWAYGFDETLGFHAGRSSLNLNLLGETSEALTSSTPMVTDPTTTQMATEGTVAINGEGIVVTEATSVSTTVSGTIASDGNDIMAVTGATIALSDTPTEGTVTNNMITGGTIVSGAFDIGATFTEPTTEQVAPKNSSAVTDSSNTPTYYPTIAPVMLTDIFTPVADTFLEFNSSESFGIRSRLRVDGQPQRITLLRFDMTPLVLNKAVELLSVKLSLYALTSSAYGGRVDILDEDICNEWDEEISWTTAPPGVFVDTPESLGTFGEINEYEWNEASLSLKLQYVPLQFTVRISSDRGNGVTYASRENSTAVPKLIIQYMGTPYEGTEVPTPSPVESDGALSSSAFEITSSPTARPTKSPITDTPTMSPAEPVVIKVGRDAMLRNGIYSDSLFGYDPFIAMKSSTNPDWEGKSILQFDLSDVSPDVDNSYELQLFITYVGPDDERTITVSQLTENFRWGEDWITWNRLGSPSMESLGSGDITTGDIGSYVSIPLGQVDAIDGRVNLVVEITSGTSEGSKVDYMAKENGSNPPLLVASP
ncbi:hypothetical protein HJC23_007697 [Cyclotella cryptica]|uniref:DOMON domain-containing protein n=1 Tax=Cyclotella cryptica TaxID=29204 RepID=A0ABD3PRT9_9STRA|eukprot:CCRYP_012267-RA/>CCRYP_012267-RA protein AED:0.16 eAED:0.16 QI:14/1/1/1/0.6/0.5/6/3280/1208